MPNYNFCFTDPIIIEGFKIRLDGVSFDRLSFEFDENGDIVVSILNKDGE